MAERVGIRTHGPTRERRAIACKRDHFKPLSHRSANSGNPTRAPLNHACSLRPLLIIRNPH